MALTDDMKMKQSLDAHVCERKGWLATPQSLQDLLMKIPRSLHNCLQSVLKHEVKNKHKLDTTNFLSVGEKESFKTWEVDLERQMQAWRENSYWVDQPPELKEVISRRVLIDEGLRQVVEVEQAVIWRFLWWSGTISVQVSVDQNRSDHTVKFKQGKSGFMKRFEGTWKVEPLFLDKELCSPYEPKSWAEYNTCSGGKGRVGSIVSLDQLIQPALVPPPPISWYLRGVTERTTEMLIHDLFAEALRLRGGATMNSVPRQRLEADSDKKIGFAVNGSSDIKERWRHRRSKRRQSSCKA